MEINMSEITHLMNKYQKLDTKGSVIRGRMHNCLRDLISRFSWKIERINHSVGINDVYDIKLSSPVSAEMSTIFSTLGVDRIKSSNDIIFGLGRIDDGKLSMSTYYVTFENLEAALLELGVKFSAEERAHLCLVKEKCTQVSSLKQELEILLGE